MLKGIQLDLSNVVAEYRFHGATRSGAHAFTCWIAALLGPDKFAYFDSVVLTDGLRPDGIPYGGETNTLPSVPFCGTPSFLAYQLENSCLDVSSKVSFVTDFGVDILFLRDPFNLLASKIAHARKFGGEFPSSGGMEVWMAHAREFLRPEKLTKVPLLRINFPQWLTSEPYRQRIARWLERTDVDVSLPEEVPGVRGGSSFTGVAATPSPGELLGRWYSFIDDPDFYTVIDYPELLEMAGTLWPKMTATYHQMRQKRGTSGK